MRDHQDPIMEALDAIYDARLDRHAVAQILKAQAPHVRYGVYDVLQGAEDAYAHEARRILEDEIL